MERVRRKDVVPGVANLPEYTPPVVRTVIMQVRV